jgi:hypothetical protein
MTSRTGTLLLDLLVSIMMIGVLCGVFALILKRTMQAQHLQAESFNRIQQSKAVGDQFRADVARAKEAPQQWRRYVADETTLILKMSDDEHVVYLRTEKSLKRIEQTRDDLKERLVVVPLAMTVEFLQPRDTKLVRLRLTPTRFGKELPGQSLEFAAMVGGDAR